MRLTVLGFSAVRPNPGAACAGYLVEHSGQRLLIDCGPGVTAQLMHHCRPRELEAVVLSHAHPDHCTDVLFLRQSLRFGPEVEQGDGLPVWVGPESEPVIRALGDVFADGGDFWPPAIDLRIFDPTRALAIGAFAVRFFATRHYVPCWGMRVSTNDGVIAYSADTGPCSALAEIGRDADLFLVECTLLDRAGFEAQFGHLSAFEAGQAAAEARARHLVLTHTFDDYAPEDLIARAALAYDGPIDVARDDQVWTVR